MNFLSGLFLVAVGSAALVYSQQVFNFTGRIDFVERRLPGGSSSFIKLIAVLTVVLGLLFITGLGSAITQPLTDNLHRVFGGVEQ